MKIRDGFVSNSSSSSFIIEMKHFTDEQWEIICNRKKYIPIIVKKFMEDESLWENLSSDSRYELYYWKGYWEEAKKFNNEEKFYNDLVDWENWTVIKRSEYNDPIEEKNKGYYPTHYFKNLQEYPEDIVLFSSIIVNFDMETFLELIGVDISKILAELD